MTATEAPAVLFPPGTHIGYDREGNRVHVGDVVETRDGGPVSGVYVRAVAEYAEHAAAFVARFRTMPFSEKATGERVRVVRRWDDPRGIVQEGDPILAPSGEPWDRTVRVKVRGDGMVLAYEPNGGPRVLWTRWRKVQDDLQQDRTGTLDTVTLTFTPDPKE